MERPATTERDPLTGKVIGLAIEVHRALGPGFLESAYEECLCFELDQHGIAFRRQVPLPVRYKNVLDVGYRLDLIIEGELVVELKAIEKLLPVHEAQLLSYLKLGGCRTGLLLNFNVPVLREGLRRFVV